MIQIEDKIISLDIFETYFFCDLSVASALVLKVILEPLFYTRKKILEEIYEKLSSYMSKEGKVEVEKNGVSTIDKDGDLTTTLVKNKECSFVIFENGC